MNEELLKQYAERVIELLDRAPASNRDANFYRSSDFLQRALLDAIIGAVHEPRVDDGLARWSMENSEWGDMELLKAVAGFLILLRGWDLPS